MALDASATLMLGISGRLSGVDGWAVYDGNDFGTALVDPSRRSLLVENALNYMTDKRMDGIDVLMNDINLTAGHVPNMVALGHFLQELRSVLPADKLLTLTVGVGWQHADYPLDLSMVDWLNVRAFENGLTVGPGAPLGQPSPYTFMVEGIQIWLNDHGIPADKLVIGIPAFGVRYDALDADGNNLDWGSYAYMPYQEILAADGTAYGKEYLPNVAKGVYYNGIPLVQEKATFIREQNLKGAYLWAGDYDVLGEHALMKALYDTLHE
ncbi:MAG: glycosyl hydrolase family 18 protein [Sphingobacteriaceae bacterium]